VLKQSLRRTRRVHRLLEGHPPGGGKRHRDARHTRIGGGVGVDISPTQKHAQAIAILVE
jgi:hypothetical protein